MSASAALGIWMATALLMSDDSPIAEAARSYEVSMLLAVDSSPAISTANVTDLLHDIKKAANRLLGECWHLSVRSAPVDDLVRLPNPDTLIAEGHEKVDKVLLVRLFLRPDAIPHTIVVHEYDSVLRSWGPRTSEVVRSDRLLSNQVFAACLRAFRPRGEIVGKERGRAKLSLRGAVLIPALSDVSLLRAGDPLAILRLREEKEEAAELVPWSYLIARGEASTARRFEEEADVVSAFRDPLTRRSRQRVRLAAIACKVGDQRTTTVEFRTRTPDDRPIVGYEAAAKPFGQAGVLPLGNTDYSGKIAVSIPDIAGGPARQARLVEVLLMSGGLVLARFPVVPGDQPDLLARTTIDPLLPEIAGRVIAFQERLVDLAAQRKILELRLKKAHAEQKEELMKQLALKINGLSDREQMSHQLEELHQFALARSKELGQKSMGANLRRLFLQTEALVERSVPQEKYQIQVQATETPAEPKAAAKATP